jgi:hypothetical protein
MPSLPTIQPDDVRHSKTAPDGGAFDAPVVEGHEAARADYLQRLGDDALVLGQRCPSGAGMRRRWRSTSALPISRST